jgi:hypothetical protein
MLENAAAAGGPEARALLPERKLILSRRHTIAAPSGHMDGGGNAWDTVKPLHKWFKHLNRVILVDDDAYKVHACSRIPHEKFCGAGFSLVQSDSPLACKINVCSW